MLGSASPRRHALLTLTQIPFVVCAGAADESLLPGESPEGYVERVALAKIDALDLAAVGSCAGILAADTVVVTDGRRIVGKPENDVEARAGLESLSGKTHEVITRFVLAEADARKRPVHAQTVKTRVTMRPLTMLDVISYVASGEGRDKAGGYAIQGSAAGFVERIEGSYTNVVGLPLAEVVVALRSLRWLDDR